MREIARNRLFLGRAPVRTGSSGRQLEPSPKSVYTLTGRRQPELTPRRLRAARKELDAELARLREAEVRIARIEGNCLVQNCSVQ